MILSVNSSPYPVGQDGMQSDQVQKLEQQKQQLQKQLNGVKSNKKLSNEQKQKQLDAIQKQIKIIEEKIQALKRPQNKPTQTNSPEGDSPATTDNLNMLI